LSALSSSRPARFGRWYVERLESLRGRTMEQPDFSSPRSFAGPTELRRAFENAHRAIEVMFSERGLDHAFVARLPALLLDSEYEGIANENDAPIVPGGSPVARMMGLST
jgi:hypothetical protein